MILMMFMLPAGIADGILAGSALVLILGQYFGDKNIVESRE
jgi:non-canonical (house-cleaning) NTP pyrophosphatase